MQRITTFLIPLILVMLSCSKNSTPVPANTVVINGTTYPTVIINGQKWTTVNYRGPGGGQVKGISDDEQSTGDYYNSSAITLPAGWRVPSADDFNKLLANYAGAKDYYNNDLVNVVYTTYYMDATGWRTVTGTNSIGFDAYPAGFISDNNGQGNIAELSSLGISTYFLSTSEPAVAPGYNFTMIVYSQSESYNGFTYGINMGLVTRTNFYGSLRFVKDN